MRTVSIASLLLLAASPALADQGAHVAVVTKKVDGIGTCQGKGVVGNFVFSKDFIPNDAPKPPNLVTELRFKKGSPPEEWFGRSYFTCTEGDAVAGVGESRNHKIRTRVSWGDGRDQSMSILSDVNDESKGWNTLAFTGNTTNTKLAALPAGAHKLLVARALEYEVPIVVLGKIVRWEGRYVVLADGELKVVVE